MDKAKIVKLIITLSVIVVFVGVISRLLQQNSMSLTEYAQQQDKNNTIESDSSESNAPDTSNHDSEQQSPIGSIEQQNPIEGSSQHPSDLTSQESVETQDEINSVDKNSSLLTGASLNGSACISTRVTLEDGFYYESISDNLRRYITGVSYPSDSKNAPEITIEELCYVHILHYDFKGNPSEGELICHGAIAQDLLEIFAELYHNEYQIEKVLLIDEYDGDDLASMEANNTSCFNYREVEGSNRLSKHAYGLAIDINPLYNPYITYNKDGTENVSPGTATAYADRSQHFSYKIDENDLCYKLFKEHGFTWGGNWNNVKDYQHFQKSLP